MYRLKEIQDSLLHLVGWKQSYNPANAIRTDLTATTSGLYFEGAHALCTQNNIRAIMPDDFLFQYPVFNTATAYIAGNKVSHVNKVWEALQASTNKTPGAVGSEADWREYNYLSDYLETETREGIASMVQNFITQKQLANETRNLFERINFFDGAGHLANTIPNQSRIVGFEIQPVKSMGVTIKVERIGLQMKGGTGTVKVYVFHSSQVQPYRELELEITSDKGGFVWFQITDLYLPYISEETNAGGFWYLCYNQDDLPANMEAINVSKDWSREPCTGCNIGSIYEWRELTKYMRISPFKKVAPTDFQQFPELWNLTENMYTNATSYGMNVQVSVGCDLTDFIISQSGIFADVLQKQTAYNVMRKMAMNPEVRVNRNQSNVARQEILYELDGVPDAKRPGGLGNDLKKAYEALKLDTRNLDALCLKCNNHGVRYRTV